MKKFLLIASAAMLTSSLAGADVTVDNICWRDGKAPAYMIASGDYSYYSMPVVQTAKTYFEKIDANTIRIHNFLDLIEYADFILEDGQLKLKNNRQTVNLLAGGTVSICRGDIDDLGWDSGYRWYYNFGAPQEEYRGDVTDRGDHKYYIHFADNLFVDFGDTYKNQIYQNVQICTYAPNAVVTDKVTDYAGNVLDRRYEVTFAIDENNGISFTNFANKGCALEAGINGNTPYFNTSIVKGVASETDGTSRSFSIETGPLFAGLNATPYKELFNLIDDYGNTTNAWLYSPGGLNVLTLYFGKHTYEADGEWLRDVDGSINAEVAHNDDAVAHGWTAQDGGQRVTSEGIVGTMETYIIWNENRNGLLGLPYGEIQTVENTRMDFGSSDVTLEAVIDIASTTYDETEGLKVKGNVATVNNGKYVSGYDLYLIPGKHETVAGNDDFNDAANGHMSAIAMSQYETAVTRSNAADRDFSIEIPAEDIKDLTTSYEGKFTLYAKANYTAESALSPTFHALTPVEVQVNTGVDNVYDNGDSAKVIAGYGEITVTGFAGRVLIYNAQGATVYDGNADTVALAAGIYFVHTGNKTAKVMVK